MYANPLMLLTFIFTLYVEEYLLVYSFQIKFPKNCADKNLIHICGYNKHFSSINFNNCNHFDLKCTICNEFGQYLRT